MAFLILIGRWLESSLMHPNRRLTLCSRRSTAPICAYIRPMLCLAHMRCTIIPLKQRAWSSLIFRGTPCWAMYLFGNFSMLGPFAFVTSFRAGNYEKRSMHARKYTSLPCQSINGPPKSSCISSFGSEHGGKGVQ